jgi:hypothetical protein
MYMRIIFLYIIYVHARVCMLVLSCILITDMFSLQHKVTPDVISAYTSMRDRGILKENLTQVVNLTHVDTIRGLNAFINDTVEDTGVDVRVGKSLNMVYKVSRGQGAAESSGYLDDDDRRCKRQAVLRFMSNSNEVSYLGHVLPTGVEVKVGESKGVEEVRSELLQVDQSKDLLADEINLLMKEYKATRVGHTRIYVHVYIYIHIYACICIYIYIYIYHAHACYK